MLIFICTLVFLLRFDRFFTRWLLNVDYTPKTFLGTGKYLVALRIGFSFSAGKQILMLLLALLLRI